MADAALQKMKETLGLDEGETITQNTITGNTESRKKNMEQRPLPTNTPFHDSTFRAQPKCKKRQIDDHVESVDV